MLGHNDNYFHPLYYDTLKVNGFWNYAFVDREHGIRIILLGIKRLKLCREIMNSSALMP